MSSERKNSRLPPPAFPPGTRKKVHKNSSGTKKASGDAPLEGDAYISPDDPLPPRTDKLAFISPDDPLPARADKVAGAFISPEEPLPPRRDASQPDEEGVVTGMGFDAHVQPAELASAGDPYVMEVSHAVRKLADALKRKGEAGLRASPGMSRFEATLRAYCVGYIAGRRAEDEEERSEIGRRAQHKAEQPDS
ncbi:MAG TPA: hypothetical protein VMM35_12075 [Longimicrobiales bacterium]|nr:hypothetical protein [Longimicrobiales bacterium]